jgi:hypothetical protein
MAFDYYPAKVFVEKKSVTPAILYKVLLVIPRCGSRDNLTQSFRNLYIYREYKESGSVALSIPFSPIKITPQNKVKFMSRSC